jgi:methionyl aminopeptidase
MIVYIKSKEDIDKFKIVGRWTAGLLSKLLKEAKEGVTTKDLDSIARRECFAAEMNPIFLDYSGYPAAICASVNEVLVHGIPNDRKLQNGDILSIDIGAERLGYIGDTAESIVIGGAQSDIVDRCRDALRVGISKAVAGNRLSDISEAIQRIIRYKPGYSIALFYGGHGIDKHVLHADPFVPNIPDRSEDDIKLRPGMILAIEPMLIDSTSGVTTVSQEDNWSVIADGVAAHCEHTILITDEEPFILTDRAQL